MVVSKNGLEAIGKDRFNANDVLDFSQFWFIERCCFDMCGCQIGFFLYSTEIFLTSWVFVVCTLSAPHLYGSERILAFTMNL